LAKNAKVLVVHCSILRAFPAHKHLLEDVREIVEYGIQNSYVAVARNGHFMACFRLKINALRSDSNHV
jgi:hypothetical protein